MGVFDEDLDDAILELFGSSEQAKLIPAMATYEVVEEKIVKPEAVESAEDVVAAKLIALAKTLLMITKKLDTYKVEITGYADLVTVWLWGDLGRKLALDSGNSPGDWYGFEPSSDVYLSPQRNYAWVDSGVHFSYIESHGQAGLTIEEAADEAGVVLSDKARKVIQTLAKPPTEEPHDIPF